MYLFFSDAGTGGSGGALVPQYLADQLTLFKPGEGRLSPPITAGPPKFFHLPASLSSSKKTKPLCTQAQFNKMFKK